MLMGMDSYAVCGGPDATVHLVFPVRADGPGGRGLAYQRYKGGKWEDAVQVSAEMAQEIAVAADNDGNAHIVWGTKGKFRHVYSKDGAWQTGSEG